MSVSTLQTRTLTLLFVGAVLGAGASWAVSKHPTEVAQKPDVVLVPSPQQPSLEEGKAALTDALRLIDPAAVGGVWRNEHARKLRMLMSRMSASQRMEAMQALSNAINGRKLTLEASPPF